jgi:hypothetical protein
MGRADRVNSSYHDKCTKNCAWQTESFPYIMTNAHKNVQEEDEGLVKCTEK